MATASRKLIDALRATASRVQTGVRYEWGHMAHCNCGHLIQTVTEQDGAEVAKVVQHHLLEWTEHARDYCPNSGHAVEDLFRALADIGFGRQDVVNLEKLSDPLVSNHIGRDTHLKRNRREDLVIYLNALADVLEGQMEEPEEVKAGDGAAGQESPAEVVATT